MGAEGGKAGAIARVEQHHADDRITSAERGIEAVDGEAFGLQRLDGGLDAGIAGDHLARDLGQAHGLGDDLVLHVALEHLGQALGAGLGLGVAGAHAVGDIEVADDVHRDVDGLMIGLALERQGDDATLLVAGLQVHQHVGGHFAVRVVELAGEAVEQTGRQLVTLDGEPLLVRVVDEVTVRHLLTQIEVGKEVVGGETLEILPQGRSQGSLLAGSLAVGEAEGALFVPDVHGPDVGHGVEPGGLFDIKPQGLQLGLEAFDGVFQRRVLAGNKSVVGHHNILIFIGSCSVADNSMSGGKSGQDNPIPGAGQGAVGGLNRLGY